MLSFDEARQQLFSQANCVALPENVPLAALNGRVLAEPVAAGINVPPEDNSAMDGFALALADLPENGQLPVSQKIFAGTAPEPLQPGTAVRLFTGSVIPAGADTVVLQEDCDYSDEVVTIRERPRLGQHIRRAGEDIQAGQLLLPAGIRLDARHLGLLASAGVAGAKVYQPLKVALLATGDELKQPGEPLNSGQIYNSNLYMLQAALQAQGYQVTARHVADDLAALETALQQLLAAHDVLISIGGVSVGEADLVRTAMAALGEIQLWKVNMKPGKPLSFGMLSGKPMLGLPGNPVSAFATYQLFARPYLARLQGEVAEEPALPQYPIRLVKPLAPRRDDFIRVRLQWHGGEAYLEPFSHQGSGVLSSVAWATGFARIPAAQTTENGDSVSYIPFTLWGY